MATVPGIAAIPPEPELHIQKRKAVLGSFRIGQLSARAGELSPGSTTMFFTVFTSSLAPTSRLRLPSWILNSTSCNQELHRHGITRVSETWETRGGVRSLLLMFHVSLTSSNFERVFMTSTPPTVTPTLTPTQVDWALLAEAGRRLLTRGKLGWELNAARCIVQPHGRALGTQPAGKKQMRAPEKR